MPIYEYQCTKCHELCEVLQKLRDKPLEKCPKCGGPVVKRISSPAIQFKGNGWYITDYAKKNSTPAGHTSEPHHGDGDKPAAKAEAKPASPKPAGSGSDKSSS